MDIRETRIIISEITFKLRYVILIIIILYALFLIALLCQGNENAGRIICDVSDLLLVTY